MMLLQKKVCDSNIIIKAINIKLKKKTSIKKPNQNVNIYSFLLKLK